MTKLMAHASPRYQLIYAMVRRIPLGQVATYGQIAHLLGLPGHARQVGYALFRVQPDVDVPWQRVVNAQGKISYSPARLGADDLQCQLLQEEGLIFTDAGVICNFRQHLWRPTPEDLAASQNSDPQVLDRG